MKSIAFQFEQWQTALESFQKNVEKDLEEIRKCKSEVQQMKVDILDRMDQGKYIQDESRIILSAPEIIIGNVDKSGVLKGPSHVTVRANNIQLEGVGLGADIGGSITNRASSIRNIAEDPGCDGMEKVVHPTSEIVSQAKCIVLQGERADGIFPSLAGSGIPGIQLNTDAYIELNALRPCEFQKEQLSSLEKGLKERVSDYKSQSNEAKQKVNSLMKKMNDLLDGETLNETAISTRLNFTDIEELHNEFNSLSSALYYALTDYFRSLSLWAESNRQLDCVKEQASDVDKLKSKYKDAPTGTQIIMRSENLHVLSMDGDGNLRTNPESGVQVTAKYVDVNTQAYDGSLMEDSQIKLTAKNVEISTANTKYKDEKKEEAQIPAEGDVRIVSKNILMESVDYELKDKKIQETALTKEGTINIRAEKVNVTATDTEGKATGKIAVNAKAVEMKSMDIDKEKGTDKSLTAGSTMFLLSEKMFAGSKDSKTKSKQVQIASDSVGVFGDTTVELQQGDGKGVVQLNGGNAAVSGGNLDLYGTTTLQGKTTFKADVAMGDLDVKNIKIQTSFKSPYTSEGVAVPGAPSTAKLSAKLKEEEVPSTNGKA